MVRGDELNPHIIRMLSHGMLSVDVVFHPAIPASHFSSRKDMAAQCHTMIAHGVACALYGRLHHIRGSFAPLRVKHDILL